MAARDYTSVGAVNVSAVVKDVPRYSSRAARESSVVAGLLPLGAELETVMGPFPEGGFGWYLVRDADPADPAFDEGWIAAGYEPDPFLSATGRVATVDEMVIFRIENGTVAQAWEVYDESGMWRQLGVDPPSR